jgi:diguanylate cyclase (GGDEF)-like protein
LRSTRSIEILCLALGALGMLLTGVMAHAAWPAIGLLAAFAAAIVVFHARPFPGRNRLRLAVESWTMLAFVSGVLCFTGRGASPLLNLYLLPVVLSALTLGRAATLLQVAALCLLQVLLGAVTPGVDLFTAAYASRVVGELAPILLVAYLTTALSADMSEARERIENLAQTDPLTGLYNSRRFDEIWQRLHRAAADGGQSYALLMVDVEKLKAINDVFGHDAGNSALVLVARCLQRSIRSGDTAARYGGDEFMVLLPGASAASAEIVAKRMRNVVYKTTLDLRSRMIHCSVNIGIAVHPADSRDARELLAVAERHVHRDRELRRVPGIPSRI